MPISLQRIVLTLLPALLLLALAGIAIWGESGLLVRERLRAELQTSFDERAALDRENQNLVRELKQMREDPVVLERAVAEGLGLTREGTILIRFR